MERASIKFDNPSSTMKHRIDPKIDCVFKALLGSEQNRNLLVHFLNAILTSDLTAPITEAEILNPYNDKEFLDDCERGGCQSQRQRRKALPD